MLCLYGFGSSCWRYCRMRCQATLKLDAMHAVLQLHSYISVQQKVSLHKQLPDGLWHVWLHLQ